MGKTILLTGATDGIGYQTAEKLLGEDHRVLAHGRNPAKLDKVQSELGSVGTIETFSADLSELSQVKRMADEIKLKHTGIDVLIKNAGVFKLKNPLAENGLDQRFLVNTIAPS